MDKGFILFLCISFSCGVFSVHAYAYAQETEQNQSSLPEKTCDRGESYYDGCNWCRCRNGLTVCTRRACGNTRRATTTIITPVLNRVRVPREDRFGRDEDLNKKLESLEQNCMSAEATFDGCNWCWCSEDGGNAKECTHQICEK